MDSNVEDIEQNIETTYTRLLKFKWLVIVGTLLSACLSVYVALNQPDRYTAQVFLSPVTKNEDGGLGKLAGQFGGLASMAGVSLGGGQGSDIDAALEFMKTRGFIQPFINNRQLLPELFALKSWDKETKKPIYDLDTYNPKEKVWHLVDDDTMPTAWDGYDKLLTQIDALYIKKKDLVELKVTTVSPELSVKMTNWLIEDINEFWRAKDKNEAEEVIEYLKAQALKTNVSELRSVFYELIAEQTRTKLLSSVGDYHILKPLSPIVYPEKKSGPSRGLICIGITFFGGLLSLILAFVLSLRSKVE